MNNYINFVKVIFFTSLLLSGCASETYLSSWQNKPIVIDGKKSDWTGKFSFNEEEQIAIAVENDNDFLYICLVTSNKSKIREILKPGFTVWLDPQDSDGETIGVQFPIRKRLSTNLNSNRSSSIVNKKNNINNLNELVSRIKSNQTELLIVNENRIPLNSLPIKGSGSLELNLGMVKDQLIYELKIPIANNTKEINFIDIIPGEEVEISFESGKNNNNSDIRRRGSGNMMQGGQRGVRQGRPGVRRNKIQNSEPINYSIKVKLSSSNIINVN